VYFTFTEGLTHVNASAQSNSPFLVYVSYKTEIWTESHWEWAWKMEEHAIGSENMPTLIIQFLIPTQISSLAQICLLCLNAVCTGAHRGLGNWCSNVQEFYKHWFITVLNTSKLKWGMVGTFKMEICKHFTKVFFLES
jgi:hypothetical protein